MGKRTVAKDFDVVNSPPPMDGSNFTENPGIEPRTSIPEDPGEKASNDTGPVRTSGKVPGYPKGSGY